MLTFKEKLEKYKTEREAKEAKLKEKKRKANIKKHNEIRSKKRAIARKEKEKARAQSMLEEKKAKEKELKKIESEKRRQASMARARAKYNKKKKEERDAIKNKENRAIERSVIRRDKKIAMLEVKDAERKQVAKEKRAVRKRRNYARTFMSTQKNLATREFIAEQAKEGNLYSDYWVIITKNYKLWKSLKRYRWSKDAYDVYNSKIEQNEKEVLFPTKLRNGGGYNKGVEYEIMILEQTDCDNNVTTFRNSDGKFEDNIVVDAEQYKIIAKHEWLVEETFNVYGYNPNNDRKTFAFIRDEIIMNNLNADTMKRIFTYKKALIIQENSDIDIVLCKSKNDSIRLYGALQKNIGDNKYVFFSGACSPGLYSWIIEVVNEKTGWEKEA